MKETLIVICPDCGAENDLGEKALLTYRRSIAVSLNRKCGSCGEMICEDETEFIIRTTKVCESCEGTGRDFYSCCGDDMRGRDIDNCPSCKEHTGWDGKGTGDCFECKGKGVVSL